MTTTEADVGELPYPEHRGQTHYEGCYRKRHHHNCAVRRVEELEAQVERLREALEPFFEGADEYTGSIASMLIRLVEEKDELGGEIVRESFDAAARALRKPQTGE